MMSTIQRSSAYDIFADLQSVGKADFDMSHLNPTTDFCLECFHTSCGACMAKKDEEAYLTFNMPRGEYFFGEFSENSTNSTKKNLKRGWEDDIVIEVENLDEEEPEKFTPKKSKKVTTYKQTHVALYFFERFGTDISDLRESNKHADYDRVMKVMLGCSEELLADVNLPNFRERIRACVKHAARRESSLKMYPLSKHKPEIYCAIDEIVQSGKY